MHIDNLRVPAQRYLPQGILDKFIVSADPNGDITGTQRDLDVQISILESERMIELVYLNFDEHAESVQKNGKLEVRYEATQANLDSALTHYRLLVATIYDIRRRVHGSV